jgi:hypothetical protein
MRADGARRNTYLEPASENTTCSRIAPDIHSEVREFRPSFEDAAQRRSGGSVRAYERIAS